MQIMPFQKFVHNTRIWCFYMLPLSIHTFMLAVLMLNEHTLLTVVTRTTTENPAFCVLKANEER